MLELIFHILMVAPCATDDCVMNHASTIAAYDLESDCERAAMLIRISGGLAWCEDEGRQIAEGESL